MWSQQVCCLQQCRVVWAADVTRLEAGEGRGGKGSDRAEMLPWPPGIQPSVCLTWALGDNWCIHLYQLYQCYTLARDCVPDFVSYDFGLPCHSAQPSQKTNHNSRTPRLWLLSVIGVTRSFSLFLTLSPSLPLTLSVCLSLSFPPLSPSSSYPVPTMPSCDTLSPMDLCPLHFHLFPKMVNGSLNSD